MQFNMKYGVHFYKDVYPDFKVPTEYEITSKFLPMVYKEKLESINESINSSTASCLLIDELTNVRGESITGIAITS